MILENEFIEQLFLNQSDNEIIKDFYEFILSDFTGYNLICDFNNTDEYEKAVSENPIWELILDKIDKIIFNSSLKTEIEHNDFYETIGEHNIFLTTHSEKKCSDLSNKKGYIYLSDENISTVWNDYTKDKRNNTFKVSNSDIIPDELKFNCWSKLTDFSKPLTSILIFDKYILNDISHQKMIHNIFPLFDNLLHNINKNKDITITIICEPKNWNIEQRQKQVNAFFVSKGFTNVTVNIIKHLKVFYPNNFEGLHGRVIFTNYYHLRSDDSFNYFNKKRINNDVDLKINFCLSKTNKLFYMKELSDIKRYVSKLNNDPNNPKEEYKILFYPNKVNYLLN